MLQLFRARFWYFPSIADTGSQRSTAHSLRVEMKEGRQVHTDLSQTAGTTSVFHCGCGTRMHG